jgi:hypothetical protein
VSTTALVFWIIAIVLAVFALVFVLVGANGERGYWSQRDPSGNARKEATKVSAIAARPWRYASGEYRAPLRIMAIGVVMLELAVVSAIVALLVGIIG